MASMSAKSCNISNTCCQVSTPTTLQEKAIRNKRKFRAESPLGDPGKILSLPQSDCSGYEFSAEKFEIASGQGQTMVCDLCNVHKSQSDGLKLDLGLSSVGPTPEVGPSPQREELEGDEFQDVDWSDLTESQLEELALNNLDTIFRSAIKKIVACGYTEEVATKAVLRSGLYYGRKDIVSNIVDNTTAFLRNGQDIDLPREHYFSDLQQLEKYVLAELVCVLREVRPFFSTGDAMWCLLICDMNVSHACAMDGDSLSSFVTDGSSTPSSSTTAQPQSTSEGKSSELNLPNPSNPVPAPPHTQNARLQEATMAPNISKSNGPLLDSGLEKESTSSVLGNVDKPVDVSGASQSHALENSRKVHGSSSRREHTLRQKSLHLEKHLRTYGSKGSRGGKHNSLHNSLGGLLDKKLKPASESATVSLKTASMKLRQAMGEDLPRSSVVGELHVETTPAFSELPQTNTLAASSVMGSLPALPIPGMPSSFPTANTELTLSLPVKTDCSSAPVNSNSEGTNDGYIGMPYDKSTGQWVIQDKKDEMILKLVPRVRELQNQLHEWTEWANQKVMQAARRLSKDKAELKTLRQDKEEVERLKKEKQTLEENTMKKLSEMENALCKASGQVERANSAVRRLEVENATLRQEMEIAKLRAAESAASCQEVSKREKKTLMKLQSWEKQKTAFQEELMTEKRKLGQLIQEVDQAKELQNQLEARWRQEERVKEDLLTQASSMRKEREQIEASATSKEELMKLKAETNLQKHKDEIQKLEKEISQLRLKTDSSKIAALRRGADGSYASRLLNAKNDAAHKETQATPVSVIAEFQELSGMGVKRERECVMCLTEEMSVVFLPCAHQVVCSTCNELHEKQGMKDCPSCRSPIQWRIPVRYARS